MVPIFSRAYYGASATEFLLASPPAVLGELVAHHTFAVDQNQRNAWQAEIIHLQEVANDLSDSFFFLEFAIPRMGKRADAVIVTGGHIFVIEYKVGADDYERYAIDQALDYAIDLKNFHEGSHNRTLVPILVATKAPARQLRVQAWADGVMRPILTNRETFLPTIREVLASLKSVPVDTEAWAASGDIAISPYGRSSGMAHRVDRTTTRTRRWSTVSGRRQFLPEIISQRRIWPNFVSCMARQQGYAGSTNAPTTLAVRLSSLRSVASTNYCRVQRRSQPGCVVKVKCANGAPCVGTLRRATGSLAIIGLITASVGCWLVNARLLNAY